MQTSPTAGCPLWPAAKLISDALGILFYGAQTGPCRATYTGSEKTAELFTYDAMGRLSEVSYTTVIGTTGTITFAWVDGLPKTATFADDGTAIGTTTYEYSSESLVATYARNDGSSSSQNAWALTPEGYPSTHSFGVYDQSTSSFPVSFYGHLEYANCRIQRSCTTQTCAEYSTFQYDDLGRIVSVNDGSSSATYEYVCN